MVTYKMLSKNWYAVGVGTCRMQSMLRHSGTVTFRMKVSCE